MLNAGGGAAAGRLRCPRLFPEMELLVEPEEEDEGGPGEDKLRELVQQYKARTAEVRGRDLRRSVLMQ